MGNSCMCVEPTIKPAEQDVLLEESSDDDGDVGSSSKSMRRNCENIGINIRDIEKQHQELRNSINRLIFEVAEQQKQFKQPLPMKIKPIPANKVRDPFYINEIKAFYVGEWVFSDQLDRNVPGGIGRLYEKERISEGLFQTFISEENYSKKLTQNLLMNNNTSNPFLSKVQSDQPNMFDANKVFNKLQVLFGTQSRDESSLFTTKKFTVKLHGKGRIKQIEMMSSNRKKEYVMEGNFSEGNPNGRCKLVVLDSNEEFYSYEGEWKDGSKEGKGVQKGKQKQFVDKKNQNMKEFRYDGRFHNNEKSGKGSMTFVESKKEEHAREADLQKFQLQVKNDGQEMRIAVKTRLRVEEYREGLLGKLLNIEKYPGSEVTLKLNQKLISDFNFNFLRENRKVFQETYIGEFKHDKMHGFGFYQWSNKKVYNGEWKDNKMDGKGEFFWPDGEYYQGEYENDERHGAGVMIWNKFKRYRGYWAFGVRHGYGESIEINQEDIEYQGYNNDRIRVKIKGSLWNKDKVQTTYFQDECALKWEEYAKIQHFQKEVVAEETGKKESDQQQRSLFGLFNG